MITIVFLLNVLLAQQQNVDSFAPLLTGSSATTSRYYSNDKSSRLHMASVERRNQQQRRRQVSSTNASLSSSSSTTSTRFPSIFPGQSLAHNLHEVVLGVLINSNHNGQNVLSRQSLSVKKKKSSRLLSSSSWEDGVDTLTFLLTKKNRDVPGRAFRLSPA